MPVAKMRLLFLFIAVAIFSVIVEGNQAVDSLAKDCSKNCLLQFRCYPYYHPDNEVVWTIEDGVCRPFSNMCMFSAHNCHLENQCKKPLEQVPGKKCQELCPTCDDTGIKALVCVEWGPYYSHSMETFPNRCAADRFACLNAFPYGAITNGPCIP